MIPSMRAHCARFESKSSRKDSTTYHHYHGTNGKKVHGISAGMRVHKEDLWNQFSKADSSISLTEDFAMTTSLDADGHKQVS